MEYFAILVNNRNHSFYILNTPIHTFYGIVIIIIIIIIIIIELYGMLIIIIGPGVNNTYSLPHILHHSESILRI
jgi:hypothetical protein